VLQQVSRASRLPLYDQIESDIARRITSGEWSPGAKVPPEHELCRLFGASRITVRHALGNLVARGLVAREAGRGTFVREPAVTAGARGLTSFTGEMAALGLRAGARVLKSAVEPASPDVADRLDVAPGERLVIISRLRLGNGKPIGIQTAHLPARRFPGLERADLENRSLYEYLEQRYGIVPREADETFLVAPLRGREARLLGVTPGICGLLVERVTYDSAGPYEFVASTMRADRYRIRLGLRALGPEVLR
jgi:GntR family transcriptional regulator